MSRHCRIVLIVVLACAIANEAQAVSAGGQSRKCSLLAGPPLQGESHLTRTSLPSVYDLEKFVCAWDEPAGVYWWSSPLKRGSVNPIYGGHSGNASSEVGYGWWLTSPKYFDITPTSWSSHSFVATRVPAFNHTSCCCQVMSGDSETQKFWLTEYCRAVVPGLQKTPSETCQPYMDPPCPTDNATALQEQWPMPPYSESYSACLDPLGTSLPMPKLVQPARQEFAWLNPRTIASILVPTTCLLFLLAVWKARRDPEKSEMDYKILSGDKASSESETKLGA